MMYHAARLAGSMPHGGARGCQHVMQNIIACKYILWNRVDSRFFVL